MIELLEHILASLGSGLVRRAIHFHVVRSIPDGIAIPRHEVRCKQRLPCNDTEFNVDNQSALTLFHQVVR